MNAEFSQQGDLKLPLTGLALRRAFQGGMETLATPGRQRKALQSVRDRPLSPSDQTGNKWRRGATGQGESHSVEKSAGWGHVPIYPHGLTLPPDTGQELCLGEEAFEMGCWLRQTLPGMFKKGFDRNRPPRAKPPSYAGL